MISHFGHNLCIYYFFRVLLLYLLDRASVIDKNSVKMQTIVGGKIIDGPTGSTNVTLTKCVFTPEYMCSSVMKIYIP